MAKGAISSEGSGGENLQHFSTIRIRATGLATLNIKVYSLDDVREKALALYFIRTKDRIQPNRLVNFIEQRASFEITTTVLDEYYRINRIIVYMKEIYTSHPGA